MTATRQGSAAPTQKQRGLFLRLIRSPLFSDTERIKALHWLDTQATRKNISAQLAWLGEQRRDRTGR